MDQNIVDEVFTFLEDNKVTIRPEKDEFSESVAEFMHRNKLKIGKWSFTNQVDKMRWVGGR